MDAVRQFIRFGAVGVLNTAVGFGATSASMWLGAGLVAANAFGYAFGFSCSFLLNRRWTFRFDGQGSAGLRRFACVVAAAYLVNLALVTALGARPEVNPYAAQLAGMCAYTAFSFAGLRWWAFVPASPTSPSWRAAASWWPEIAASLAWVAATAVLLHVSLGHDAVWQLWLARQMEHGARLYTDLVEVNPPLWFWMAVPVVDLARWLGAEARDVLRAGFFAVLALSLLLVARLRADRAPTERMALYACVLLAGTVAALPDFGQREHFTAMAVLPYILLTADRADGRTPRAGLCVAIACLAACGLALKVYFAALPVALELWLVLVLRRSWTPVRPELIALGALAALYAACVLAFAPGYLRNVVPMLLLTYGAFGNPPLFYLAFQLAVPLLLVAALGTFTYGGPRTTTGRASLLAAAVFAAAFLAQHKGWRYQSLPALAAVLMLAAAELAAMRGPLRKHGPGAIALLSVVALVLLEPLQLGAYRNPRYAEVDAALSGLRAGDPVMILSVESTAIWPVVEDRGLAWPSRYMSLWMLPAIAQAGPGPLPGGLREVAQAVRQQMVEDLSCHLPRRILVDDETLAFGAAHPFSYLGFLREHPPLAELLAHYTERPRHGRFRSLELESGATLPAPPPRCRAIG